MMRLVSIVGLAFLLVGCGGGSKPYLTVYASQDEVYAEPILRAFSSETGIEVRTLFDSEAVKTVGLANRLIAERGAPQADVFWSNEELRTRQLAAMGVFRGSKGWVSFGSRTRRLVVNTQLVSLASAPASLDALTNAQWRGKIALAYPMFGSTSTHFQVLRQRWGEARWLDWCKAIHANQPYLVDGNSLVVQLVGRGQAAIGLTDSDDVAAGAREGLPIRALPLTEEMLGIPNTLGLIRGRSHPELADQLVAYLQKPSVLKRLIDANALESGDLPLIPVRQAIQWDRLLEELPRSTEALSSVFLR